MSLSRLARPTLLRATSCCCECQANIHNQKAMACVALSSLDEILKRTRIMGDVGVRQVAGVARP